MSRHPQRETNGETAQGGAGRRSADVLLPGPPSLPALYRLALGGAARRRLWRAAVATVLPAVVHRATGVRVDTAALTRFQHFIGASARDQVPSTYIHTVAFPVAMSLLARPDFPLPLLGMVHLSNEVQQVRQILATEPLDVTARAEGLRPHSSGTQVDVVVEVRAEQELVWTGRSVYLARGIRPSQGSAPRSMGTAAAAADEETAPTSPPPVFEAPRPTGVWHLATDTGRRYAAVSGDWNPIHLNGPAAKALGMKTLIAHGMYLAARMVEQAAPAPQGALSWRVDFATPVLLPSTVTTSFRTGSGHDDGARTDVVGWSAGRNRPHFTGWVRAE